MIRHRTWGALGFALVVALVAAEAHAQVAVISRNDTWKWFAGPAEPDPDWETTSYSDSAWAAGPGILGFGETYVATVIPYGPSAGNKWITTYFRRTFTISQTPSSLNAFNLAVNYDDGFVMYLNGVEILRRFMRPGPVAWDTLAMSHEGGVYEPYNLAAFIPLLVQGENVIAVEVHQSTNGSSDLVWDAELTQSRPVYVTRGPYVQMGSHDGMTLRWRTSDPATSQVRIGEPGGFLTSAGRDSTLRTEHEMRVTGLGPRTSYGYSVGTLDSTLAGDDSLHVFTTHPIPGTPTPTRIWAIGDSGHPNADQAATRDSYLAWTGNRGTDVWLMLGDNAYSSGTDFQYQTAVFDRFQPLLRTVPLWPTRGNHDRTIAAPEIDMYDIFTLPDSGQSGGVPSGSERYFSFDYGDVHFICLDSEGSSRLPGSAMHAWLREDLASTERMWVIAYWHHPPYSKGSHDSDDDLDSGGRMGDMRRYTLPILDSTGVDLVLTGHSHAYERSFLINGHYDVSSTLAPEMIVDGGRGRADVDSAYRKPTLGTGAFEGAVYVVAGSAATTAGGSLDHPVMVESWNLHGSLVIDVLGARLDARFLTNTGVMRDSFTILKGPRTVAVSESPVTSPLALRLIGANPVAGEARFRLGLPAAGPARLEILDVAGRLVATPAQGEFKAGEHSIRWNGRDRRGKPVPSGVYFAVLERSGEHRAVRVVLAR